MSNLYNVSASPHVRSKASTAKIMLDVIIALLPAAGFGIYNFGLSAALVILITVATCVCTEFCYEKLMKLPVTIGDLSAVVTGLLLALNLPASAPWWMCVLGGVFAILVVKMLFGGIGQNFMNPALAARCFLMISFAGRMTAWVYDGVSAATPMAKLRSGATPELLTYFIGNYAGTIGETSALCLLIGACYLLIKKVITWKIPVIYVATTVIFIGIFGRFGFDVKYLLSEVLTGGLLIGAFFMANDYTTSPITAWGQVIYAVLLGVLTGIFRLWGATTEGVSYAIIISNLLVPLIEKVTIPAPFGKAGAKKA